MASGQSERVVYTVLENWGFIGILIGAEELIQPSSRRFLGLMLLISGVVALAVRWHVDKFFKPSRAPVDLPARARRLSEELGLFLAGSERPHMFPWNRQRDLTDEARLARFDAEVQASEAESRQLLTMYTIQYAGRVLAIHQELLQAGVPPVEKRMDGSMYNSPTNKIVMQMIQSDLAARAEVLDQKIIESGRAQ